MLNMLCEFEWGEWPCCILTMRLLSFSYEGENALKEEVADMFKCFLSKKMDYHLIFAYHFRNWHYHNILMMLGE